MVVCNATLPGEPIEEVPATSSNGITFHQIALIVIASCTLIASILSFVLIFKHALHYSRSWEQRQWVSSTRLMVCDIDTEQHHKNNSHGTRIQHIFVSQCIFLH